jgi:hypothetical protein
MQRIKGAIDRTIAEEQARMKALSDQPSTSASARRSGSSGKNESPARRSRVKKVVQESSRDSSDGLLNPDPAVFEAAFVLDDSEDPSRTATPRLPDQDEVKENGEGNASKVSGAEDSVLPAAETTDEGVSQAKKPDPPELPPEVRAKLRKLEKLESTYPGTSPLYVLRHLRN